MCVSGRIEMTAAVILDIDPALPAEAEQLGIDTKRLIGGELYRQIEKAKQARIWKEENRAAIDEWNRELQENGLWYENLRRT